MPQQFCLRLNHLAVVTLYSLSHFPQSGQFDYSAIFPVFCHRTLPKKAESFVFEPIVMLAKQSRLGVHLSLSVHPPRSNATLT